MKKLIIAEKPSVAADLSKALGKFKKIEDYYENDHYVIASAVGHLVELFMPQDIDPKLKVWNINLLPIIPEVFQLKPIEKTSKKFMGLKKLMARKDVDGIINACDAGREGELIFTYIYELAKCKKTVQRMWMMSMTKDGITQAFGKLREEKETLPLQAAARCRSESDWLIGINGTRVITSRLFGFKGGQAATVGRVQTPTLALVVEREKEIRDFVSQPFWRIKGHFKLQEGEYEAFLLRTNYKEPLHKNDRIDRFWEEKTVETIIAELSHAKKAKVTDEKKRTTQAPPRLYDLTTLQREANNRFGLPAGRTLQILQSLYEKHKMITYPRTDSNALPEDYVPTCKDTLASLSSEFSSFATTVLEKDWVKLSNKRVFNNAQVSDHFAIIPTTQSMGDLTHDEAKIYDTIVRRFIAVFYPSAEYDVTTRYSDIEHYRFKTEGKILASPGWLAVYGKEEAKGESSLPALSKEDGSPPQANVVSIESEESKTNPPPRYTEATLLAAMESAGKLVEDEELAAAMKEKGLGTPATRAQTIEHLIYEKYIDRQQRELIPTTKAEHLIEFLKAIGIEALISPALTGEWEHKLKQMEHKQTTREAFMQDIADLTSQIVQKAKAFDENTVNAQETTILSPIDGSPLIETIRAYKSKDGLFTVNKVISNRRMQPEEVQKLVTERAIGPLDGFKSKMGKPFSAILRLDEEHKVRFIFDNQAMGEARAKADMLNLAECSIVAPCPYCTKNPPGNIYELPTSYACEHQVKKEGACTFRIGRTLLERTIDKDQFIKLITKKKTDLLDKFKSKRTGRFFSAHLVLKEDGKIGFEFAPRPTVLNKRSAKKNSEGPPEKPKLAKLKRSSNNKEKKVTAKTKKST